MIDSVVASAGTGVPASGVLVMDFDEVYRLHAAGVHRFCVALVGEAAVAEDLTHETFLRAFSAYVRVHPSPETVRSWLLTIARNLCTDHHRHQGRWRGLISRMRAEPATHSEVELVAERRSELERVTAALAGMNSRDRELIGLRVAADLSYNEIAEVIGSTESVVKVATFRALTKLRSRLEEAK